MKFLIIDDNPLDRELIIAHLRRFFKNAEYQEITDEQVFREALEKADFDIVLTDYQLYWSDGLQILQQVREKYPDVPVLMVTGTGSEEAAVEGLKSGLYDYILKKHISKLPHAVQSCLEKKRLRTELKTAIHRLTQSEALFREMVENARYVAFRYILKPERHFEYVSPSSIKVLGYTPEEHYADPDLVFKSIHPDDHSIIQKAFSQPEHIVNPKIIRMYRKDRSLIWVESHSTPLYNENSDYIGINGIIMDVTDRQLAEETLRRNKARFKAISELVSDYIYELRVNEDGELKLCWITDSLYRDSGYKKQDLSNLTKMMEYVHSEDIGKAKQHLQKLLSGQSDVCEFRVKDESNQIKWIRNYARPILDEEGKKVIRIYGAAQDITEHILKDLELEEAHAFNQAILNSLQSNVAVLDKKGNIIAVNAAWERFARENDAPKFVCDGVGINYFEVCKNAQGKEIAIAHKILRGIKSVLNGKRDLFKLEYPCHSPSQKRWFKLYVTPLKNHKKGVVVSHIDITQLKLSEESLSRSQQELQHRNKSLKILHSLSRTLQQTLELNEIAHQSVRILRKYRKNLGVIFFSLNIDQNHLKMLFAEGISKEMIENVKILPIEGSLNGYAVKTRKVISSNDLSRDKRLVPRVQNLLRSENYKTVVVIPLQFRNKVYGTIAFTFKEDYLLREDERSFFRAIGRTIGMAMANAEYIRKLRIEIQEKVEAEKKLIWIRERLQQVISASPATIYTLKIENGKAIPNFVSSHIKRILGYLPEECLDQPNWWIDHVHPDDRAVVKANQEKLFKCGYLVHEYRIRHANGSYRWIRDELRLIYDDQKNPVEMIGAWIDIHDRKIMEDNLRESETRYRKFFEEDISAVYISTPEGKLLDCNPAFLKIFGFNSVEQVKKFNSEFLFARPHERANLIKLVKNKRKLENIEIEMRRIDGQPIQVIANIFGIFDDEGSLIKIKKYLFDITEMKHLEQQLIQAQKMEAIGQLAGGIAHDFNNLLTVINGYAELLLNRMSPDDPYFHEIHQILKAGERASSLTNQLLAFSRKQVIKPKVLNLNQVLLDTEKMLRRLIGEDIILETNFDNDLGYIKMDKGQIDQVIVNLAVNAQDAMPRGGKLTIATTNVDIDKEIHGSYETILPGKYIKLSVRDNGIGMDKETLKHIFEPFFTTKGRDKGTGLGLSTVYGIIKQNRGFIQVHSQPGKGTVFEIYLPRLSEVQEQRRDESEFTQIPHGSGTILLVEDDEAVRLLAKNVLEEHGYLIFCASNGTDALKFADQFSGKIDLILTDVVMPEINGREMVEKITQSQPEAKIIYMSGYTDDAVLKHGVKYGETNFIHKPFNPRDLLKKVKEVLEQ